MGGRPRTISREEALPLFKQGMGDVEVATYFTEKGKRISKQGIRLIRLEFEKEGILEKRTRRRGRQAKAVKPGVDGELTLEQVEEVLIHWKEQAAKVPALEKEVWRLQNKLAATKALLEGEQAGSAKRKDQERRFKNAMQQGEVNPPLNTSGKAPVSKMMFNASGEDVGRTIYELLNKNPTLDLVVPDNIMKSALDSPAWYDIILGQWLNPAITKSFKKQELEEDKSRFNDKNCVLWQRKLRKLKKRR